eukprot:438096_1
MSIIRWKCKSTTVEMMSIDGPGVGSSLWLLKSKITHIAAQLLVIEQILIKLHAMVATLHSQRRDNEKEEEEKTARARERNEKMQQKKQILRHKTVIKSSKMLKEKNSKIKYQCIVCRSRETRLDVDDGICTKCCIMSGV